MKNAKIICNVDELEKNVKGILYKGVYMLSVTGCDESEHEIIQGMKKLDKGTAVLSLARLRQKTVTSKIVECDKVIAAYCGEVEVAGDSPFKENSATKKMPNRNGIGVLSLHLPHTITLKPSRSATIKEADVLSQDSSVDTNTFDRNFNSKAIKKREQEGSGGCGASILGRWKNNIIDLSQTPVQGKLLREGASSYRVNQNKVVSVTILVPEGCRVGLPLGKSTISERLFTNIQKSDVKPTTCDSATKEGATVFPGNGEKEQQDVFSQVYLPTCIYSGSVSLLSNGQLSPQTVQGLKWAADSKLRFIPHGPGLMITTAEGAHSVDGSSEVNGCNLREDATNYFQKSSSSHGTTPEKYSDCRRKIGLKMKSNSDTDTSLEDVRLTYCGDWQCGQRHGFGIEMDLLQRNPATSSSVAMSCGTLGGHSGNLGAASSCPSCSRLRSCAPLFSMALPIESNLSSGGSITTSSPLFSSRLPFAEPSLIKYIGPFSYGGREGVANLFHYPSSSNSSFPAICISSIWKDGSISMYHPDDDTCPSFLRSRGSRNTGDGGIMDPCTTAQSQRIDVRHLNTGYVMTSSKWNFSDLSFEDLVLSPPNTASALETIGKFSRKSSRRRISANKNDIKNAFSSDSICSKGRSHLMYQRHLDGIWEGLFANLDDYLSTTTASLLKTKYDSISEEENLNCSHVNTSAKTKCVSVPSIIDESSNSLRNKPPSYSMQIDTPRAQMWSRMFEAVRTPEFQSLIASFQLLLILMCQFGSRAGGELPWSELGTGTVGDDCNSLLQSKLRRSMKNKKDADYADFDILGITSLLPWASLGGSAASDSIFAPSASNVPRIETLNEYIASMNTMCNNSASVTEQGSCMTDESNEPSSLSRSPSKSPRRSPGKHHRAPQPIPSPSIPISVLPPPFVGTYPSFPRPRGSRPSQPITTSNFLGACDNVTSFIVSIRFRIMSVIASNPSLATLMSNDLRVNMAKGTTKKGASESICDAMNVLVSHKFHKNAAEKKTMTPKHVDTKSKDTLRGLLERCFFALEEPESVRSLSNSSSTLDVADEVLFFSWDYMYPVVAPVLESQCGCTADVRAWASDIALTAAKHADTTEIEISAMKRHQKPQTSLLHHIPLATRVIMMFERCNQSMVCHIVEKGLNRVTSDNCRPTLLQIVISDFREAIFGDQMKDATVVTEAGPIYFCPQFLTTKETFLLSHDIPSISHRRKASNGLSATLRKLHLLYTVLAEECHRAACKLYEREARQTSTDYQTCEKITKLNGSNELKTHIDSTQLAQEYKTAIRTQQSHLSSKMILAREMTTLLLKDVLTLLCLKLITEERSCTSEEDEGNSGENDSVYVPLGRRAICRSTMLVSKLVVLDELIRKGVCTSSSSTSRECSLFSSKVTFATKTAFPHVIKTHASIRVPESSLEIRYTSDEFVPIAVVPVFLEALEACRGRPEHISRSFLPDDLSAVCSPELMGSAVVSGLLCTKKAAVAGLLNPSNDDHQYFHMGVQTDPSKEVPITLESMEGCNEMKGEEVAHLERCVRRTATVCTIGRVLSAIHEKQCCASLSGDEAILCCTRGLVEIESIECGSAASASISLARAVSDDVQLEDDFWLKVQNKTLGRFSSVEAVISRSISPMVVSSMEAALAVGRGTLSRQSDNGLTPVSVQVRRFLSGIFSTDRNFTSRSHKSNIATDHNKIHNLLEKSQSSREKRQRIAVDEDSTLSPTCFYLATIPELMPYQSCDDNIRSIPSSSLIGVSRWRSFDWLSSGRKMHSTQPSLSDSYALPILCSSACVAPQTLPCKLEISDIVLESIQKIRDEHFNEAISLELSTRKISSRRPTMSMFRPSLNNSELKHIPVNKRAPKRVSVRLANVVQEVGILSSIAAQQQQEQMMTKCQSAGFDDLYPPVASLAPPSISMDTDSVMWITASVSSALLGASRGFQDTRQNDNGSDLIFERCIRKSIDGSLYNIPLEPEAGPRWFTNNLTRVRRCSKKVEPQEDVVGFALRGPTDVLKPQFSSKLIRMTVSERDYSCKTSKVNESKPVSFNVASLFLSFDDTDVISLGVSSNMSFHFYSLARCMYKLCAIDLKLDNSVASRLGVEDICLEETNASRNNDTPTVSTTSSFYKDAQLSGSSDEEEDMSNVFVARVLAGDQYGNFNARSRAINSVLSPKMMKIMALECLFSVHRENSSRRRVNY